VRTGGCDASRNHRLQDSEAIRSLRVRFKTRIASLHGLSKQSFLIAPRLADTRFGLDALPD
jgi:hypothetical protein